MGSHQDELASQLLLKDKALMRRVFIVMVPQNRRWGSDQSVTNHRGVVWAEGVHEGGQGWCEGYRQKQESDASRDSGNNPNKGHCPPIHIGRKGRLTFCCSSDIHSFSFIYHTFKAATACIAQIIRKVKRKTTRRLSLNHDSFLQTTNSQSDRTSSYINYLVFSTCRLYFVVQLGLFL